MNRRDSVFCTKAGLSLVTTDVTAEETSSTLDRKDTFAAKFGVHCSAYVAGTFTVKLQHSDDDVSYSDCNDDEVILDNGKEGATVDIDAQGSEQLGYVGLKRYVQCVITPAGQSGVNNFTISNEVKVDIFDPVTP